jgi:hypothetical protein
VVSLRKEVLNFRQLEEESLATSWDHFNELVITSPNLAISDPMLLQHFYMGLSKDSIESHDAASREAFLHLSTSEARAMLDRISGKTPYTSIHNELPEEEKESTLEQQEEVLIAKSQPLQSQGLGINPEPSIPQNPNPPKEEEIQPFEISCEDDLFDDFGKSLNFQFHKRPSSKYNLIPLKKGSLKKRPNSHVGYWEKFKDSMSSELIEGEPSHLETIPIFSPYMTTLDVSFKPILNPDDSSYALSPKTHDDNRNPPRHPKHKSHEDHKDDQEEQRQWLEYMKNSYVVSKEWMDKDEALWVESKLGLDPNGEFKSISLINMTHPSLEEALDEINPRATNP